LSRSQGINKEEVHKFFKMLEACLNEDNLLNKLQRTFNVEESGSKLINKLGKFVATKGTKDIDVLTPRERGGKCKSDPICNDEEQFLPAVLILKGVNKKQQFGDDLPQ
jgi:hypothetical protein